MDRMNYADWVAHRSEMTKRHYLAQGRTEAEWLEKVTVNPRRFNDVQRHACGLPMTGEPLPDAWAFFDWETKQMVAVEEPQ